MDNMDNMNNQDLKIETYSLYEFCDSIQKAIVEGWRFDFDDNAAFPTAFGSMLTCVMKKPSGNSSNSSNSSNSITKFQGEIKAEPATVPKQKYKLKQKPEEV